MTKRCVRGRVRAQQGKACMHTGSGGCTGVAVVIRWSQNPHECADKSDYKPTDSPFSLCLSLLSFLTGISHANPLMHVPVPHTHNPPFKPPPCSPYKANTTNNACPAPQCSRSVLPDRHHPGADRCHELQVLEGGHPLPETSTLHGCCHIPPARLQGRSQHRQPPCPSL